MVDFNLSGLRPLRLPLTARDARRLSRRLEPARLGGLLAWRLCKGGSCYTCVVKGSEYRVVVEHVEVRDPLSGLRMRLPQPSGVVGGRVVWRARWSGGLLRVDSIECDAVVWDDWRVTCQGRECRGPRCLEECLSG